MMKHLYKSQENKMLFGVIGGLGEYLNIDPTVLRLIYILLTAFTGFAPGIVAYIIAAFIIPEKS